MPCPHQNYKNLYCIVFYLYAHKELLTEENGEKKKLLVPSLSLCTYLITYV